MRYNNFNLDKEQKGKKMKNNSLKIFCIVTLVVVSAFVSKAGAAEFHFFDNVNINNHDVIQKNYNKTKNSLNTNLYNITSEFNTLKETFKNNPKEKNDKDFTLFYKKLEQNSAEIAHDKKSLLKELKEEKIKFNNDLIHKEIIIPEYPIYKFLYYDAAGFEINHGYLLSQLSQYLSEPWVVYLSLAKERELDYRKAKPNEVGTDYAFCKKWQNKFEEFLKTYPDFYLKKEIEELIECYKDALE